MSFNFSVNRANRIKVDNVYKNNTYKNKEKFKDKENPNKDNRKDQSPLNNKVENDAKDGGIDFYA